MVSTNVTELVSLQGLFSRIIAGDPIQYPTARKFGMILTLLMQYKNTIERLKAEEKTEELTALLNQEIRLDITFTEEELTDFKMTPIEAYIMSKFVK